MLSKYPPQFIAKYGAEFCYGLSFIQLFEGLLSDDASDKGGLTKFGISQRAYPDIDINALTWAQAADIYYRDYWCFNRCDEFVKMGADALAYMLFDSSVNLGCSQSAKILQQKLKIKTDGIIGSRTLAAVRHLVRTQSQADVYKLVSRFAIERSFFYTKLCQGDQTQWRFYAGWMNRLDGILDAAINANKAHPYGC